MPELTESDVARLLRHGPDELVNDISKDAFEGVLGENRAELLEAGVIEIDPASVEEDRVVEDIELPFSSEVRPVNIGWETEFDEEKEHDIVLDVDEAVPKHATELARDLGENWIERLIYEVQTMAEMASYSKRQFEVMFLRPAAGERKIGEILDINVGTVRSHAQRARSKTQSMELALEVHRRIERTDGTKSRAPSR